MYVFEDTIIPLSQVEKNVKAIAKKGEIQNLSVYPSTGKHGDLWLRIQNKPADFFDVDEKIREFDREAKKKYWEAKANANTKKVENQNVINDLIEDSIDGIKTAIQFNELLDPDGEEVKKLKVKLKEMESEINNKTEKINNYKSEMHRLDSEAEKILEEANKKIKSWGYDPSIFQSSLRARMQFDHFLSKAGLKDEILKL